MYIVPIIIGSKSDMEYAIRAKKKLEKLGIEGVIRIASAHKSTEHLLKILEIYEKSENVKVYITIAGLSNSLSAVVDSNVTEPVIACPVYSKSFNGVDIFSSLRMPSDVCPMVLLDIGNAALAAAKILGVVDFGIRKKIIEIHDESSFKIIKDDKIFSCEKID